MFKLLSCAIVGLLLLQSGCAAHNTYSSTDRKNDQLGVEHTRTVVYNHEIVTLVCHINEAGTEVCR
jgi:uncharacterized membrane protein YjjP (DUF1212 family)